MSSGSLKTHYGFNNTVIKNGKIVRLRKDGTVKAVLGDYKANHKNVPNKK